MINHSDGLVVDGGYDMYGGDLIALPLGRYFLNYLVMEELVPNKIAV